MNTIHYRCLLQWARKQPDRVAIIAAGRRTTYAELAQGAQRAATWWHLNGIRQGDHVACAFQEDDSQTLAQIELMYGLAWLGAVLLLVPQGAAKVTLGPFLRRLNSNWLMASSTEQSDMIGFAHTQTRCVTTYQAWRADRGAAGAEPHQSDVPAVSDASLAFAFELTSGTTGTPKLVLHTHGHYLAALQGVQSVLGFQASDVLLGPMRWPGKVGWRSVLRSHCWGAVHVEETMPRTWEDLIRLQGDTGLTGSNPSPGQLRALLASAPPGAALATPLRVMSAAGAAVLPSDVVQARAQLCSAFQVLYASTETGIIAHLPADASPNAALRIVPGVQVQVMGAAGQKLPVGEVGRLHIRSPWGACGYWQNPAENTLSFVGGGFLSDDTGHLTADGGLMLVGRVGDTINFGGVKIAPRQVEAILLQFPALADAAVVACPHVTAGEIPVAFLVFKGSPDMPALHQFMTEHLDHYYFPVAFVPCMRLPRTAEGKLDQAALRALFVSRLTVKP